MKIHHVQTTYEDRWVLDPQLGTVKRREAVMKESSMESITVPAGVFASCPKGETFSIGPDSSFELPEDVAAHFLNMPNWSRGVNPFAPEEPPQGPFARSKVSARES